MNALPSSPMLSWLLSYLFNALWQIPLVFAAAWIVARMLHREDPRVAHRVWVGALLLEVLLPACDLRIASQVVAQVSLWFGQQGSSGKGGVRVLLGPGEIKGNLLHLPSVLFAAIAVAYGCLVLYFAARLAWGLFKTHVLARSAARIALPGEAALRWTKHCRHLRVTPLQPEIAVSLHVTSPVTIGLRRGLLLLPPAFLEEIAPADLDAVLAHELVHIARCDFAKNLLYGLVSLPVIWHPLLWRTRSHVAESRELICDATAADLIAAGAVLIGADALAGRRQYAQSLLRLASMLSTSPPGAALHAIGIFSFSRKDSNPDSRTFERRIMTLTRKPAQMTRARRIIVATACSALALATCASALALRTDVSATTAANANARPAKIHVDPKIMQNQKISGENPVYPKEARAKKIQGAVVLTAVIGKDGTIENLRVVKTPDPSLAESAIKAVNTWRYRPYLLNGDAVEVETTVNVVYSLEA